MRTTHSKQSAAPASQSSAPKPDPLVSAFGGPNPNRAAIDIADSFGGATRGRHMVDLVMQALYKAGRTVRLPMTSRFMGWFRPPEPH